MSSHVKHDTIYVPRLGSQNAQADRNSKQKLKRKMQISTSFLQATSKKSPEIGLKLSERNKIKYRFKMESVTNVKRKLHSAAVVSRLNKESKALPASKAETSSNAEDVFAFTSPQSELNSSVLRTISRMLQENKIIRQHWVSMSQGKR